MRLPIRARLTVFFVLFMAAMLALVGAFLVTRLRSDLRSAIDQELRSSSSAIRQDFEQEGPVGFHEISSAALHRSGSIAQVLNGRGDLVASYGGDAAQDPVLSAAQTASALRSGTRLSSLAVGDSGEPYRVLTAPAGTRSGPSVLLAVAEPLGATNEAVRQALVLLLIVGPIALAAAGFAGWMLVRNALRPVDRIRRMAELIGIEQLDERLSSPNPSDEIGELVTTLNAMLDRLEAGVAARRRLIADTSHELRTPLTAMRAELDVTLRQVDPDSSEAAALTSVREEVDRLSRTVNNLLTLARADDGALALLRGPVELDAAVRATCGPLQALAESKQVHLRCEQAADPITIDADSQQLRQALTNLIENAIKFTPPGGVVSVSCWRRDGEVGVTVTDTGPGISPEVQAKVFERFYRADSSRSRESGGSGLGLAITAEIAAAHGGRVWLESEEGAGSQFSIALPAGERPAVADPA